MRHKLNFTQIQFRSIRYTYLRIIFPELNYSYVKDDKMKKACQERFSEKIRELMKRYGHEKTRPQIIAISARETMENHPECRRFLSRPPKKTQRIQLTPKYHIFLSSKSFRILHDSPSYLRVFFVLRQPDDTRWKSKLALTLRHIFGICPSDLNTVIGRGTNYIDLDVSSSPAFLFHVLHSRVANFLD